MSLRGEPPNRLTPRQKEALVLLAEGFSYQEAADRMGITRGVFRYHVMRGYRRLGIEPAGRQASSITAFRILGWLAVPDQTAA